MIILADKKKMSVSLAGRKTNANPKKKKRCFYAEQAKYCLNQKQTILPPPLLRRRIAQRIMNGAEREERKNCKKRS